MIALGVRKAAMAVGALRGIIRVAEQVGGLLRDS